MAGQLLTDEPLDGVRRLTISNPSKRNALDHAILDAIAAALGALADEVGCVAGWLDAQAARIRLEHCDGGLSSCVASLPSFQPGVGMMPERRG